MHFTDNVILMGDFMAITGENISKFIYIVLDDNDPALSIQNYLSTKLMEVESKHVAFFNDQSKIFFELSEKVNYNNTILGFHRHATIQNEYFRINNMSQSACLRAVRFVITKDGRIWSDNTHWTLAYILKYGVDVTVLDIPMYIVDFRENVPIIFDKNGAVFDSLFDVKSSIASAQRIQERLDKGWRPLNLSYKIINLKNDICKLLMKEGNDNVQDKNK